MLINLTYKCSMGCTHCVSACEKTGEEMTLDVLNDVCDFIEKYKIDTIFPLTLVISGGEIFEHSRILECLDIIFTRFASNPNILIALTTNGRILSETQDYLDYLKTMIAKYGKHKIYVQVTDDDRFYPIKLTQKQRYNLENLGATINSVPSNKGDRNKCLYPQGRALLNYDEKWWNTTAPKCVNCRFLTYQGINTFREVVQLLSSYMKNCTPAISPLGEIKIGESRLCPPVATIYNTDDEIISGIKNCKCNSCKESINIFRKNNLLLSNILYPIDK